MFPYHQPSPTTTSAMAHHSGPGPPLTNMTPTSVSSPCVQMQQHSPNPNISSTNNHRPSTFWPPTPSPDAGNSHYIVLFFVLFFLVLQKVQDFIFAISYLSKISCIFNLPFQAMEDIVEQDITTHYSTPHLMDTLVTLLQPLLILFIHRHYQHSVVCYHLYHHNRYYHL